MLATFKFGDLIQFTEILLIFGVSSLRECLSTEESSALHVLKDNGLVVIA